MPDLINKHCRPRKQDEPPLAPASIAELLPEVPEWRQDEDGRAIQRAFRFKDFYETMAFVNALAWIANREDHHPDLEVGYNRCVVHFSTHSIGGLSENDFICAARIDQLIQAES